MRQFLKNLFRDPRTTTKTRPERRPARTRLMLEGLEDRTVPSTAGLSEGNLQVVVSPNASIEFLEHTSGSDRFVEVIGAGTTAPQFPINAINTVTVIVEGQDTINVSDSNGMPFNANTTISLHGNELTSVLSLSGTRSVNGNETYFASTDESGDGQISLDNLAFEFNDSIAAVTDSIPITGIYFVETSGPNVVASTFHLTKNSQTLNGLGEIAGGKVTYSAKPTVQVDEYASAATITLDASRATGEKNFVADMWGDYDSTTVVAAPAHMSTSVIADASNQVAQLDGNSGSVLFEGNQSTTTIIGQPESGDEDSTHEIFANVSVVGVGTVWVVDNANTSTPENVHVTESSVSGTGLFGNNSVKLNYTDVKFLTLFTGQDADIYTVAASHAGDAFYAQINIEDFSTVEMIVNVTIADNNNLNLQLYNSNPNNGTAELFVHVPNTVSLSGGENGTGSLGITFPDGSASQILYQNYGEVEVIG